MAQRTLQVENRIRNGRAVVDSGRTHADVIAKAVAERVDVLSVDDIKKLIEGLCGNLELHSHRLGAAEDRNVAEQGDDVVPREGRDAAKERVLVRYGRVRGRVENALGAAGLVRYGLDGETPRTPAALASHVENTINLMRSDPTTIDDELSEPVSTTTFAAKLAEVHAPLAASLATLGTEARENEAALTDRDRALAEWTIVYQSVATILSGLYRLAGRDDLADRIRPTDRRATGLEGPPADVTTTDSSGDPTGGPTVA